MTHLFLAYSFVWLLIVGYIYYISRKQIKVEKELDKLKEYLDSITDNQV